MSKNKEPKIKITYRKNKEASNKFVELLINSLMKNNFISEDNDDIRHEGINKGSDGRG